MQQQSMPEPKVKPELTKDEITKILTILSNLASTNVVSPQVYNQEIVPLIQKLAQLNT